MVIVTRGSTVMSDRLEIAEVTTEETWYTVGLSIPYQQERVTLQQRQARRPGRAFEVGSPRLCSGLS